MNPIWRRAFNYIDAELRINPMAPLPPSPPPKLNMYDPIPEELLRNLPPWVKKLQTVAYLLMIPYALVLVIGMLGERMGFWP